MKKDITFKGDWSTVIYTAIAFVIVIVLGILNNGFSSYTSGEWIFTLAAISGILLFVSWDTYQIYVTIKEDKVLINSGQRALIKDRINIQSIRYIARVQAFSWKSWGSLMVLYFIDDNGQLAAAYLREKNYSENALRAILREIKRINPATELADQYIKFLNGTLPSWPYFKNLPAEKLVIDTDSEMMRLFGRRK